MTAALTFASIHWYQPLVYARWYRSERLPPRFSSVHAFVSTSQSQPEGDAALVEAMSRGNQAAAAALYDRHGDMLFGIALRIVRERADAESVVMEALMQAWRNAVNYDATRATVAGWLVTLVRTRALDFLRSRGRRERLAEAAQRSGEAGDTAAVEMPQVEERLDESSRAVVVNRALGALPDMQRNCIELAFFEGLTHSEIAERLGQPLGTVKTRIRLGMTKLRDALSTIVGELTP
jgi:RNA polymerase sigma-70 factor (ECF subfamily)